MSEEQKRKDANENKILKMFIKLILVMSIISVTIILYNTIPYIKLPKKTEFVLEKLSYKIPREFVDFKDRYYVKTNKDDDSHYYTYYEDKSYCTVTIRYVTELQEHHHNSIDNYLRNVLDISEKYKVRENPNGWIEYEKFVEEDQLLSNVAIYQDGENYYAIKYEFFDRSRGEGFDLDSYKVCATGYKKILNSFEIIK